MSDKIRCPACRGAKKVPKLGGMIGECNTCEGDGQILAINKPIPCVSEPAPIVNEIIAATAQCIPSTDYTAKPFKPVDAVEVIEPVNPVEIDIKVDPKKAIFKRKTNR